jgi:hypothetical protein
MIRSISWKVTVAYSSAWMLVLLVAASGYTQPIRESALQKKITLRSEHFSAEMVLQRIETLAQIHFVYSSSLIELNKPLVVSFHERPLKEVLDVIGKQLGLELKMQGNYVILKKLATPHLFTPGSSAVASRMARPAVLIQAPIAMYVPEPGFDEDSLITYRKLKRSLLGGKSDFGLDTTFLRRYLRQPVHTVLKPSTHTRWHVLFSAFANDYAVGTEVRAGVRALYVVGNTGYMRSGEFRNGLGVGSSINIKPGVQLNPIYSYGRMRREEDFSAFSKLKVTSQHHQLKLLVSFAVTDHISFQLGPSFNVLKSSYDFQREGMRQKIIILRDTRGQSTTASMGWTEAGSIHSSGLDYVQATESGEDVTFTAKPTQATAAIRRFDYHAVRSWVGFETGITYSINFSRRP